MAFRPPRRLPVRSMQRVPITGINQAARVAAVGGHRRVDIDVLARLGVAVHEHNNSRAQMAQGINSFTPEVRGHRIHAGRFPPKTGGGPPVFGGNRPAWIRCPLTSGVKELIPCAIWARELLCSWTATPRRARTSISTRRWPPTAATRAA